MNRHLPLADGVPNLDLDDLAVDLETAGGELDDANARYPPGEAGEEVGLTDAGAAFT